MEKVSSFLSSFLGGRGAGSGGSSEPAATVTSIIVYPVKSCRGIFVPRAPVSSTGFRWDRHWLVVNPKGRARTQRTDPKLALVEVELPVNAFDEDWEPTDNSYLVMRAPGMDALKVPLSKACDAIDGISIWEWSGSAFDEGTEASTWFSSYLGNSSRLVRFNTSSETRPVDPSYAQGHITMFADCFPFLVISQGSLNTLNELLQEPVPINRFRPNIVVDGCEPFSEDLWKTIKIDNLTFNGVKLCSRCKMPTINQENGIASVEPTETLMKFRSDHVLNLNKKKQGTVYFGQNLVCKESLASGKGKCLTVGDQIFVLEELASSASAPV